MSLKNPLSIPISEKWNQMLLIVNQHRMLLQPNLAQQLKKLFVQRFITENIFVFIIQYIGLNLGTISADAAPLWFATGTSCAYLFLRGNTILPGMWLGTFSAYLLAKSGVLIAMGCATVFTLQAVLLLRFCYRFLGPTLIFYSLKKFTVFILYTALLTAVSSFILLSLCYTSISSGETALQICLQWWLANFNGILIFSCAFVTFDAYILDLYASKNLKNPILIIGFLLVLIIALIFSHTLISASALALLITLVTIYISLCFGWCGSITAAFLSAILLSFAGFFNSPLFSIYSGSVTLLSLQLYLCINTMIALSLAIKSKAN
jgi:hypothetical protein